MKVFAHARSAFAEMEGLEDALDTIMGNERMCSVCVWYWPTLRERNFSGQLSVSGHTPVLFTVGDYFVLLSEGPVVSTGKGVVEDVWMKCFADASS
eukprot:scaffold1910_cov23-Tisochrysis_lutea.AAC.3